MVRSKVESWLDGPGDLREAVVEDVPHKGESVRVRALPAYVASDAASDSLDIVQTPEGRTTTKINSAKLEIRQFAEGVIEPKFTYGQAETIAKKFGPAFRSVVDKITELSAIDNEAAEAAQSRFQNGDAAAVAEAHANGGSATAPTGSGGPDVSSRTGVRVEDAGQGDV